MTKSIKNIPAQNMDEYIAGFPNEIQTMLNAIRSAIQKAVPGAEETIKYGIPTFSFHGNLVSFGAWKKHIGLYPVPRNVDAFKKELSAYKGAKSTAQFPIGQPIPLNLITRIVKFQAHKKAEKEKTKKK